MKSISSGAFTSGPFVTEKSSAAGFHAKPYTFRSPRAWTSISGFALFGSSRQMHAVVSTSPPVKMPGAVPASPPSVREPLLT